MVCKKQLCACNAGYVPEDVELSGNVKEIICIQGILSNNTLELL